jgi:alginate O-acetyltransferase complex protein AlgI
MIFSSAIFLFGFLPIVLAFYLLAPTLALRNALVIAASLVFYAWGEPVAILLLLSSVVVNFALGLGIDRARATPWLARLLLGLGVAANLAALGCFKYLDFVIANLNELSSSAGLSWRLAPLGLTMPIGISFYTFQGMSYVIDVFRGSCAVETKLSRLLLVVSLFPHQIAGPIVRYADLAPQLVARRTTLDDLSCGLTRFVQGLAKKMLIANTLAYPADLIFEVHYAELTTPVAWIGVICYTLQIYFDFSGYSDMAIGLARLFGFRLKENFEHPYGARSVTEFWRRWHISLSSWFRDYLYIPLGGNRSGAARTLLNLVLVFLLCGLWHGASWSFAIWGLLHGAFLVVERVGFGQRLERWPSALRRVYTLVAVMIGWVYFRADTAVEAEHFVKAMFGLARGDGRLQTPVMYLETPVLAALAAGVFFATPGPGRALWAKLRDAARHLGVSAAGRARAGATLRLAAQVAAAAAGAITVAASTHNPFIYYRF